MKLTQQDQDAINHIASVSKHKHAALIAKWLITGCKVEFKNFKLEWEKAKHPGWLERHEYRLIEPKPPKPAYRVYIVGTITNTVDRYADGTYSINLIEGINWLTDWIEYDPDQKKWPTPLVERIAAIDIDAAQWIVDHWDDLLENRYTNKGEHSRVSDKLLSMFSWIESDQGGYYWRDIADKLGEEKI